MMLVTIHLRSTKSSEWGWNPKHSITSLTH